MILFLSAISLVGAGTNFNANGTSQISPGYCIGGSNPWGQVGNSSFGSCDAYFLVVCNPQVPYSGEIVGSVNPGVVVTQFAVSTSLPVANCGSTNQLDASVEYSAYGNALSTDIIVSVASSNPCGDYGCDEVSAGAAEWNTAVVHGSCPISTASEGGSSNLDPCIEFWWNGTMGIAGEPTPPNGASTDNSGYATWSMFVKVNYQQVSVVQIVSAECGFNSIDTQANTSSCLQTPIYQTPKLVYGNGTISQRVSGNTTLEDAAISTIVSGDTISWMSLGYAKVVQGAPSGTISGSTDPAGGAVSLAPCSQGQTSGCTYFSPSSAQQYCSTNSSSASGCSTTTTSTTITQPPLSTTTANSSSSVESSTTTTNSNSSSSSSTTTTISQKPSPPSPIPTLLYVAVAVVAISAVSSGFIVMRRRSG